MLTLADMIIVVPAIAFGKVQTILEMVILRVDTEGIWKDKVCRVQKHHRVCTINKVYLLKYLYLITY